MTKEEKISALEAKKEDLLNKLAEFYEEDPEGNFVDENIARDRAGMSEMEIRVKMWEINQQIMKEIFSK